TKKSTETRSFTWFYRNARHVGDGGFLVLTMYLSTVDLATSIPSLASSPTMRGEPQRRLVVDISRIRSRTASSSAGRPAGLRDNRAQCSRNLLASSATRTAFMESHRPSRRGLTHRLLPATDAAEGPRSPTVSTFSGRTGSRRGGGGVVRGWH